MVKGFGYYHLLCEFPRVAEMLEEKNPDFEWRKIAPYCSFMMSKSYPARLSVRDRALLKRAYLGIQIPAGSRSYRTNPEEVHVIRALGALYEALPDSMEVGTNRAPALAPSR
jgi:hypothetical protein